MTESDKRDYYCLDILRVDYSLAGSREADEDAELLLGDAELLLGDAELLLGDAGLSLDDVDEEQEELEESEERSTSLSKDSKGEIGRFLSI